MFGIVLHLSVNNLTSFCWKSSFSNKLGRTRNIFLSTRLMCCNFSVPKLSFIFKKKTKWGKSLEASFEVVEKGEVAVTSLAAPAVISVGGQRCFEWFCMPITVPGWGGSGWSSKWGLGTIFSFNVEELCPQALQSPLYCLVPAVVCSCLHSEHRSFPDPQSARRSKLNCLKKPSGWMW